MLCFKTAYEAAGASSARHSLRPLILWGEEFMQTSGAFRRENAKLWLRSFSPSPRLRGEGWGEGDSRQVSLPRVPLTRRQRWRAVSDLSPQAGRGKWTVRLFENRIGKLRNALFAVIDGKTPAPLPLRTGGSPCGRRPSGGRGCGSGRRGPSSGRNCRRPCRAGRFASGTACCWPPPFSRHDR